jgi:hypothetical protein
VVRDPKNNPAVSSDFNLLEDFSDDLKPTQEQDPSPAQTSQPLSKHLSGSQGEFKNIPLNVAFLDNNIPY